MLIGMNPPAKKTASAAPEGAAVFDVTTAEFETKVVRASMERPVLIDFWAPWCGPCKQLGPLLEQSVAAQGGKVALAKVDIDQNPELAQAFRVQSIPMVVALYQGQPVTAFAGARPKAEIDNLLAQLVKLHAQNQPDKIDISAVLKEAAAFLDQQDLQAAQQLYGAVLSQDENNVEAYTGLVRVMIAAGELEQAGLMIDNAPEKIAKAPGFSAARTALDLARAAPSDDISALAAKVRAEPENPAALFDYAEACFAKGRKDEAADALIQLIRRNRAWEDEKARKQLLRYFEAWGPADSATISGRKRLSSVLFS